MTPDVREELARLRAENARLIGLLDTHGIAWRAPGAAKAAVAAEPLSKVRHKEKRVRRSNV
jgi:hypothetical protein